MAYYIEEAKTSDVDKQKLIQVTEETERISFTTYKNAYQKYFEILLNAAKNKCPVDTGALKASIRLEEWEAGLSLPSGIHGGGEVVKEASFGKRIVAGGLTVNPKTLKEVDYAQFVHDGHFNWKTGKFVPPQPFLDEAMREAEAFLDECAEQWGKNVGDFWEKS